jgi:hypothetical protein
LSVPLIAIPESSAIITTGEDVFHDQDAEDELGERLFRFAKVTQRFDDDRRGRNGEHRAEEHAVHATPAEQLADFVTDPHHEQNFEARADQRCHADLPQLAQAEFQSQREHEKYHAEFRECVDRFLIVDEWKRRRVRPNDDASDNVTEHHRLFEAMKQHRDHPGDDHHYCEVLEERDSVHARQN